MTDTAIAGDIDVSGGPNAPAEELKRRVEDTVLEWRDRLVATSHDLHAHPELAFEEHRSAALVADLLRDAGFAVEVGVWGQDTALEAVYGNGELTVVVCAEYDALPGIGHACGHNIIATAGAGAAIALSRVADELGIRVKLLGTPAEEKGAGKAHMLEAGAWEDATVSLMVHPGPGIVVPTAGSTSQSRDRFRVEFTGRASHAAAAPSVGINAGDAATVMQVAVGLLRQHLPDTVRVSAVTLSGGDVSNIIPATAVVEAEVRSFDLAETAELKKKVLACVDGAATATGCNYAVTPVDPIYEPLVQHPFLADRFDAALGHRGRVMTPRDGGVLGGGSTDMGNVSQALPSIHPLIGVMGSTAAPHTAAFAADAISPGADDAIVDGAYALAAAIVDLATDDEARAEVLGRQRTRAPGATRRPAYV
ncbi:peptidase M20 [Rhodococcus sp. ACS1]|uniref:amidohydrolase n=1 Tax=Rhodococcus sp. ACS1 TaxID=2028570 RepID=UPI000BB11C95|nr:amidohydrolase [Rhodococcus sp. ACS1]PBC46596.1 peptidase M20 [Rhodococcus sp. ACS1]